jgi:nucleoside-diphosphate-sugar epimerase
MTTKGSPFAYGPSGDVMVRSDNCGLSLLMQITAGLRRGRFKDEPGVDFLYVDDLVPMFEKMLKDGVSKKTRATVEHNLRNMRQALAFRDENFDPPISPTLTPETTMAKAPKAPARAPMKKGGGGKKGC